MDRAFVNTVCAALPGAEVSDPWGGGHDAWKVGGRMFACIGAITPGVAVKCADVETAEMLIAAGRAERARYFHRSWVTIPFDGAEEAEVAHRLRASYALIRAALPKKLRSALPPVPEAPPPDTPLR
jgi:predicted DNA-binding protein (MmcQ/YjbR family)